MNPNSVIASTNLNAATSNTSANILQWTHILLTRGKCESSWRRASSLSSSFPLTLSLDFSSFLVSLRLSCSSFLFLSLRRSWSWLYISSVFANGLCSSQTLFYLSSCFLWQLGEFSWERLVLSEVCYFLAFAGFRPCWCSQVTFSVLKAYWPAVEVARITFDRVTLHEG